MGCSGEQVGVKADLYGTAFGAIAFFVHMRRILVQAIVSLKALNLFSISLLYVPDSWMSEIVSVFE